MCIRDRTEGERQIVRYVRGEEIENTSFIRDEQGNEYYIPAIREMAQDPDSPLVIWEMACEPNTDEMCIRDRLRAENRKVRIKK